MWLYRPIIRAVLSAKSLTILIALAILAISLWPATQLGTEFMPNLNEGTLFYMPTTLRGISVTKAADLLQTQDRIIKSFPEVVPSSNRCLVAATVRSVVGAHAARGHELGQRPLDQHQRHLQPGQRVDRGAWLSDVGTAGSCRRRAAARAVRRCDGPARVDQRVGQEHRVPGLAQRTSAPRAIWASSGLEMSSATNPTVSDVRLRRPCASRSGLYPSSSTAASTRSACPR